MTPMHSRTANARHAPATGRRTARPCPGNALAGQPPTRQAPDTRLASAAREGRIAGTAGAAAVPATGPAPCRPDVPGRAGRAHPA